MNQLSSAIVHGYYDARFRDILIERLHQHESVVASNRKVKILTLTIIRGIMPEERSETEMQPVNFNEDDIEIPADFVTLGE